MKQNVNALQEFVRLFNQGNYFESHELLEKTWAESKGKEKLFFQGLIQAAVALHHFQKKNLKGSKYELEKSIQKLKVFTPRYYGLEVGRLVQETDAFINKMQLELPNIKYHA